MTSFRSWLARMTSNYVRIGRQVTLPNSGRADLLFVDVSGRLVVVEAKLVGNGTAEREIVGQVFDYASDLSGMTFDQIDVSLTSCANTSLNSLFAGPRHSG